MKRMDTIMKKYIKAGFLGLLLSLPMSFAFAQEKTKELTIYSGRGEAFVAPVLSMFEKETGIKLNVRYGSTAEISALLQEEGEKSVADIFWAQDGAALGASSSLFDTLPKDLYQNQPSHYKSATGSWIAITGRARSFVYSTDRVKSENLPQHVSDLAKPEWKGKIGWAPGNASFQAFVTAMRVTDGEEAAQKWIAAMAENGAKKYKNNIAIVQAIADGEIDGGIVNTYYLARFKANDSKFPVEQTFFTDGDIGNLLNIAGVGILKTSQNKEGALALIKFLLSDKIQQYFASVGSEYPVVNGIIPSTTLGNVSDPTKASPVVDINKLLDVKGTQKLLQDANLL